MPNAIGANVTLTLTFTEDGSGAVATVDEADRMAIGIHDDIEGVGIADDTVVTSMNYATGELIISDVDADGSIEVTFTNEGRSPKGGSVAGTVGNQMQGHYHPTEHQQNDSGASSRYPKLSGLANTSIRWGFTASTGDTAYQVGPPTTDGTNGTPRTAKKTTGDCFKVALYMKIK